ncbi:Methylthioribulose-1-phosphate dehydratase [Yamadazyma tenuis]|uniref:Methylthioribulose-1-phosphate dehydratase n=1 Tax=Candida tenuis (strain ATCC 10573 / BCRC 21748 / CBS 615 / JCM 9827 / NBRC 10315 / NRRL Y-1498 / VKM Y-70) TaxID=590646 RepID=G3BB91_CANTC|nr:Methylthioribulose-1-phosphate dehydratase [Yamadazyma tenuis ATCC 10573]EGV61520.1 Methylthioribulose-1-phosphate dehydratase [Yamadazyma tenuis ATCC 10573]WEJ92741.1 Methylthioribulose-1-phosphate dehydratase [Yamadazyma tenuis]
MSDPQTIAKNDPFLDLDNPQHPANVICELCRLFYDNNWVTGTGGGVSIRDLDGDNKNLVYIAPSGIQKERLEPWEMFVAELPDETVLRTPNEGGYNKNYKYKASACQPLFMSCYKLRDAGACIHTHSQNAVMCTLLWEDKVEFKINHIEQIKALPRLQVNAATGKVEKVGSLENFDTLVIPIIENVPHEEDLVDDLEAAINNYPGATAVLVRRHGIYVWGENIWKAKVYNEALDYLLELAIKMKQNGIPTIKN